MLNYISEFDVLKNYFFGYLFGSPIKFISTISFVIPLILIIYKLKTIWQNNKILIIYVILILILELVGGYYAAHSWNNHLFYLIFYILESTCLFIFFKQNVKSEIIDKVNFGLTLVILIIFSLNIINSPNQINDYSLSTQSIGFIIITLLNFYYLIFIQRIQKLSDSTLFWLNTGTFLYFTGTFFVSLFITKVLKINDLSLNYLYKIIAILIIIFRIFLAIGIVKSSKKNLPL